MVFNFHVQLKSFEILPLYVCSVWKTHNIFKNSGTFLANSILLIFVKVFNTDTLSLILQNSTFSGRVLPEGTFIAFIQKVFKMLLTSISNDETLRVC